MYQESECMQSVGKASGVLKIWCIKKIKPKNQGINLNASEKKTQILERAKY